MLGADHRAVTALGAPARGGRSGGPPIAGRLACAVAPVGLALGMLVASPSGAVAAEWIVGGSVSQRLEADTNRRLDEGGEPVYGATTAVGLDVTALTPTTQWQIETGASGGVFVGSGETKGLNRLNPNFAAAVANNGKYLDTGASFAFNMRPTAIAQLDETGIVEGDTTQISVQLAADAAYALDPRNRLSVGGFGSVIRFDGGTTALVPTTTYGATLAWVRNLSRATQASLAFGARRFTADSAADPDSRTFDLSAGVNRLVNRRLSFDASLGVTATHTARTLATGRETEFALGALGGLEAAWAPAPDSQLVFALSHGLEPSSLGELRTTTAIGLGVQHALNSWTSAGADLLVQRRSSGDGFKGVPGGDTGRVPGNDADRTYATLAPSLFFFLTPDWALQTGYALRLDPESGLDSASNRVFLTLTRQFAILP
jgi:hypothetical protein